MARKFDLRTQGREAAEHLAGLTVHYRIVGIEKLLAKIKNTPGDPRQVDVPEIEQTLAAIARQRARGDHVLLSANLVKLDQLLVASRERLIAPMVQHAIRGKAIGDRLKNVGKKPNRRRSEERRRNTADGMRKPPEYGSAIPN